MTDNTAGRDGVDQLAGVENVRFSDGSTAALADLVAPVPFVADDFVMKSDANMPSVMPLALDDELFGAGADATGRHVRRGRQHPVRPDAEPVDASCGRSTA